MKQILPYVAIAGIAYLMLKQIGDMGKGIADSMPKMPDFSAIFGKQAETNAQQQARIFEQMDLNYRNLSRRQKADFEELLGKTKAAYLETGSQMTWEKFQSLINASSKAPVTAPVSTPVTWEQTKQTFSSQHQAAYAPQSKASSVVEVLKISDAPSSAFERPQNIDTSQRGWVHYFDMDTKTFQNLTYPLGSALPPGYNWGFR